jgi:hypothetical protein
VTIIEAIEDTHLFRPLFRHFDTWRTWLVVLKTMDALPMTDEELALFFQLTGRQTPLTAPAGEVWLVIGRWRGRSFIVALKAIHLACFKDYRPFLGPGERGSS